MERRWRFFILLALLAALALPAASAGAAPGAQLWLHVVDPGWDVSVRGASLAVSGGTGNVYVAGTRIEASDAGDFVLARFTSDGTRKWVRTYDRGDTEKLADIAVDRQGRVVACGTQGSDKAMLLVKYSATGRILWKKQLREPYFQISAAEMAVDSQNNIYVAGTSKRTRATAQTLFLVKYSANGSLRWKRTYSGVAGAWQLALGPDGRLYLAGLRVVRGRPMRVGVVCYTRSGVRRWTTVVGHRDSDNTINELRVKKSGVCGVGRYYSRDGMSEGLVFRLTLGGKTRYVTSIPTPASEGAHCYSCDIDGLGRVAVAGNFYEGFAVWRFSSGGSLVDSYNANVLGDAYAVATTTRGTVYATGQTDPTGGSYDYNVWTVGFTATWWPEFTPFSHGSPTSGTDSATELTLASGCFYEAGISDDDLMLAKYER